MLFSVKGDDRAKKQRHSYAIYLSVEDIYQAVPILKERATPARDLPDLIRCDVEIVRPKPGASVGFGIITLDPKGPRRLSPMPWALKRNPEGNVFHTNFAGGSNYFNPGKNYRISPEAKYRRGSITFPIPAGWFFVRGEVSVDRDEEKMLGPVKPRKFVTEEIISPSSFEDELEAALELVNEALNKTPDNVSLRFKFSDNKLHCTVTRLTRDL